MICIAFSLQFAYFSICLRAILKLQAYRMCCECLQAFLHFHTLSLSISMSSKACCLVNVCRHSFMFKPFPLSLNASLTVQFLSKFCSHSCTFTSIPSLSSRQCLQAFLHFQTLSLSIGTSFTAPVWANVCSHSFTSTPLSSQSACQCLQAFLHFRTRFPLNQYVNVCKHSFIFKPFPSQSVRHSACPLSRGFNCWGLEEFKFEAWFQEFWFPASASYVQCLFPSSQGVPWLLKKCELNNCPGILIAGGRIRMQATLECRGYDA